MRTAGGQIPPKTLEGWYVLHQVFRASWPSLKRLPAEERSAVTEKAGVLLRGWSDLGTEGWSGAYRLVGGGADYLLVHFRSSFEKLGEAERAFAGTALADHLELTYDYLSVVELGLYQLTATLAEKWVAEGGEIGSAEWREELNELAEAQRGSEFAARRLFPRQPQAMPYVCFYPMNKRREAGQNWYELALQKRSALMADHGRIGRQYAGRVSQVISGSIGLDDWEWGVTLFAGDPLEFKNVVTELRYDEVSTRYAEFGSFFVGRRTTADDWSGPELP